MDRITDYTTLVTAIQDLVDLDVGGSVDAFIQMTENDMGRRIDSLLQESTETLAVIQAGTFFTNDRRGVLRVSIDDRPLERLHPDTAKTTYQGWTPNRPQAYSVSGGTPVAPAQQHLQYWPVPPDDTTYQAEVTFKIVVPALTGANPTNWLLDIAPDVYLYGASMHAVTYNGDETNFAMYQGLHDRAAGGVITELQKYQSPPKTVSSPGAGGYERWLP